MPIAVALRGRAPRDPLFNIRDPRRAAQNRSAEIAHKLEPAMPDTLIYVSVALSLVAAVAASIAAIGAFRRRESASTVDVAGIMRQEADRLRAAGDDQARSLREEVASSIRGFLDSLLTRLDAGVGQIDARILGIGTKLDEDLRRMGEEAGRNRDSLRQTIETKLDDSLQRQATAGMELRQEVNSTITQLQSSMIQGAGEQREAQAQLFDSFARRLSESLAEGANRLVEMKALLKESLDGLVVAEDARHQAITASLDGRLKEVADVTARAAATLKEDLAANLTQLGQGSRDTLAAMGDHQKERLQAIGNALEQQGEKLAGTQEALRQTVEGRLDALRNDNTVKLEEIRKTVDEELQKTLNERITGSFKLVQDQLEQVHRGLGEMQKLADGVGDLKRVLSNVKTRGVFGEVQLGSLIEQMFSPEQYLENAQVCEGSQERVEFAIKLPGRSGEGEVLIPIDAKFPIDDYERLMAASEKGDLSGVEAASNQLRARITQFAKDIGSKYVNPPVTTEFAILFLPTEGLYAEILRAGGMVENLFERHRVFVCGPTNLLAMLNAFKMSIRAVAIQQRSTEVWQILGAVRTEFDKHGGVLGRLQKQLEASLNTVDALGTRTRAMKRKLQGVDAIGTDQIQTVLGLPPQVEEVETEGAELTEVA
jgi:DNA recombination protein RmuC